MMNAAEAEAELNAFEESKDQEMEPFVKPICDIFLEVFELNRGNNWLRGRAVVVVLHQLLGGTIERKLRENVRLLVQEEDALLRYVGLLKDALWPGVGGGEGEGSAAGNTNNKEKVLRTEVEKARTRTEAGLMLATLVPDLVGSVVGRVNAQAASRRVFAAFNNARLKYVLHLPPIPPIPRPRLHGGFTGLGWLPLSRAELTFDILVPTLPLRCWTRL